MMMVRRIRAFLGNDIDGYRLGWQIVVDGLKLAPSNPSLAAQRAFSARLSTPTPIQAQTAN